MKIQISFTRKLRIERAPKVKVIVFHEKWLNFNNMNFIEIPFISYHFKYCHKIKTFSK